MPATAMLNDVYVNGQGQDIWCRSNTIIKEAVMYGQTPQQFYDDVKRESCFFISLQGKYFYETGFDTLCVPKTKLSTYYFCMCSNN
jgi:hypothetical protein